MRLKYFATLLLIFSIALCCYCNSNKKKLFSFFGRSVTFGEFKQWCDCRTLELPVKDEDSIALFKKMALELILCDMAQRDGFCESEYFKRIERVLYWSYLSSSYINYRLIKSEYREQAFDLAFIRLNIPEVEPKAKEKIIEDKIALALFIIAQLKEGKDFQSLAEKYSEDKIYRDIYPMSAIDSSLLNFLRTIKDGEFIAFPVILNNSIFIVKRYASYDLKYSDIIKRIKSKTLLERFKSSVEAEYGNYLFSENLPEFKEAISLIDRAYFNNKNEVLFSLDGDTFTTGDFDELLSLFAFLKYDNTVAQYSLLDKREEARKIFQERIISGLAQKDNFLLTESFIQSWNCRRFSFISGLYKYSYIKEKYKETSKETPSQKELLSLKIKLEEELLSRSNFTVY